MLIPQRKGDPIEFREDEGIRADTTAESLSKLKPAFAKDGTITAGIGVADLRRRLRGRRHERGEGGRAGPHPARRDRRARRRRRPGRHAADASRRGRSSKACAREGIDPKDLDLVELNEAFAAVGIVSTRELGIDPEKVNVNGGAIALGHPVGMSGARIVLDLALELRRRGGGVGAAALCGGGGQGDALILHVPAGVSSEGTAVQTAGPAAPPAGGAGGRPTSRRWSTRAREGDARVGRPADLAGRGRQPGAARGRGGARPAHRPRPGHRPHRLARRRQVDDDDGAGAGAPGRPASGSACSRSTRRRRSPAARCSATACGCRTTPATAGSTSARWPPAGTSAGWPGPPRRRCGCSTRPAATSS